jgi:hypothetical protein
MIDTGGFGSESSPKRDLHAWTVNEALIKSNPELHHYTTRKGLEGIWKTNSLWAMHFSNVSDSSEIELLKKPLAAALATLFKPLIIERQRESFRVRRHVENKGGVEFVACELAQSFVEANYITAFTGGKLSPVAVL